MPVGRRDLFRLYEALAAVFCPGLRSSQFTYAEALSSRSVSAGQWVDLGCGRGLFPRWFRPPAWTKGPRILGIDLDLPSLKDNAVCVDRVMANLEDLPLPPASVDTFTANMVVEHVADPERFLREVYRCLKPGGVFIFHTPNADSYFVRCARLLPDGLKSRLAHQLDGRAEEDVFPTHYRLNTPDQIRTVSARIGFQPDLRMTTSAAILAVLGPFAIPELLLLRVLSSKRLAGYRPNIIALLRKP